MFALSPEPLDAAVLRRRCDTPEAGAFVEFEGRVRNHNEGRAVYRLEYEACEKLARTEGEKIIAAAAVRFPIVAVSCVHRTGRLAIGDVAVWVGVAAAHRDAAFDACRFVIDEVKARVPIWKKEDYGEERRWL